MKTFDETLAVKLGLEQAIIIQQVEYWIKVHERAGKNYRDDHYWVYNSIAEWQEQFPFWSKSTVKRILSDLREKEILITANYNKMKRDKTLWYRINYEALEKVKMDQSSEVKMTQWEETKLNQSNEKSLPLVQNDPMQEVNLTPPLDQIEPMGKGQNDPTIPNINYTKITTKITTPSFSNIFIMLWNNNYRMKTGKEPEEITEPLKNAIQAAIEAGMTEQTWRDELKIYIKGHKQPDLQEFLNRFKPKPNETEEATP